MFTKKEWEGQLYEDGKKAVYHSKLYHCKNGIVKITNVLVSAVARI